MKKFRNKNAKANSKENNDNNSFWRGTVVGLIISTVGSLVTNFIQYHYNQEQQSTQIYLDEKKEFIKACNDYLTQYKVWNDLMQYSSAKDSISTEYSQYSKKTIKAAYYKWHDDFEASYGRLYLVSDNEFGAKTLLMSAGLSNSLRAYILSDTLSVKQRFAQAADLNIFFQEHWLFEARNQILNYNTGKRNQKTDEEYFKEIKKRIIKDIESDPNRKWFGDSTILDGTEFNKAVFPEN